VPLEILALAQNACTPNEPYNIQWRLGGKKYRECLCDQHFHTYIYIFLRSSTAEHHHDYLFVHAADKCPFLTRKNSIPSSSSAAAAVNLLSLSP
jgi:hypothetical protein